jgi:hypothetical protein
VRIKCLEPPCVSKALKSLAWLNRKCQIGFVPISPDTARLLLGDMRAVAEMRGEAALWEQWAKAGFQSDQCIRAEIG